MGTMRLRGCKQKPLERDGEKLWRRPRFTSNCREEEEEEKELKLVELLKEVVLLFKHRQRTGSNEELQEIVLKLSDTEKRHIIRNFNTNPRIANRDLSANFA